MSAWEAAQRLVPVMSKHVPKGGGFGIPPGQFDVFRRRVDADHVMALRGEQQGKFAPAVPGVEDPHRRPAVDVPEQNPVLRLGV